MYNCFRSNWSDAPGSRPPAQSGCRSRSGLQRLCGRSVPVQDVLIPQLFLFHVFPVPTAGNVPSLPITASNSATRPASDNCTCSACASRCCSRAIMSIRVVITLVCNVPCAPDGALAVGAPWSISVTREKDPRKHLDTAPQSEESLPA